MRCSQCDRLVSSANYCWDCKSIGLTPLYCPRCYDNHKCPGKRTPSRGDLTAPAIKVPAPENKEERQAAREFWKGLHARQGYLITLPVSPKADFSGCWDEPCMVCGKNCPKPDFYIHVVNGGDKVVKEVVYQAFSWVYDDGGDLGRQAVGSGCVKAFPALRAFRV